MLITKGDTLIQLGIVLFAMAIGGLVGASLERARERTRERARQKKQELRDRLPVDAADLHPVADLHQVEVAQKDSKAFLNQIINVISDTIFVKDEQFRFVLVNQAVCDLVGISQEAFLGRFDYDFFPKEQADHFRQKDQLVFQTGLEDVTEEPLTAPNGDTHWLLTKKACFQTDRGQKFLVGSSRDITTLKQAEVALQQQALQEQSFSRVIQTIRNSLDLETIFSTATREFAELLQLDLVGILQAFPERRCSIPIAEHIRKPDALSLLGVEIPDENNPIAQRLKQREIVLIEDMHALTDPVNQAIAQLRDPVVRLMVPLEVNGTVWGCLIGIKSPLPATFTKDEIHLASRVADQLAIAIQQANLYQQAQRELTERKRIEAELGAREAVLRELYQVTSDRHLNFQQKLRQLLAVGCRYFQLDNGMMAVVEADICRAIATQSPLPDWVEGLVYDVNEAFCGEALQMEAPFSIQHVGATEWRNHSSYVRFGTETYLGTKVQVKNTVHAILCFTSITPCSRLIQPADQEIIKLMAQWIGGEIERQQGEAALQQLNQELEQRVQERTAALQKSRDLFEAVFQESADAIFLVDPVSLLIVDCNQRAIELFEADHNQNLVGIQGHSLHKIPFTDAELAAARQEFKLNGVWSQEIEYCTLKGRYFWGNLASKQIQVAERQMNLVRITDISDRKRVEAERKQTEAALQVSENRLRTLIEDLQVGVVVFNATLTPLLFNSKLLELMEVTADEMQHSTLLAPRWDIVREDGSPMPIAEYPMLVAVKTCQPVLNVVLGVYRPISQDRVWLLVTAAPQLDETGEVKQVITTASDISDRKRAEQALRQFAGREHLLRTVTEQIYQSLDLDSILTSTVTEVRQMLQVDRTLIFHLTSDSSGVVLKESVLPEYPTTAAMRWEDECFPPDCHFYYQQGKPRVVPNVATDEWASCLVEFMQEARVKSKVVAPIVLSIEDTLPHLWGILVVHSCSHYRQWEPAEVALLQQVANQLAIAIQQSTLYQQLQTELTERRQIETQLRASLQEKEILLKEVHHRVKNNLQVISSVLWLQAKATQHSTVFKALADTRTRLQAMALIHETLYESTNLEQLNFDDYIQRLATTILAANNTHSNSIRLVYQLQPIVLNLETAIPCGLLLNELMTNAVKHAFPDERSGEVCITLKEQVALQAGLTLSDSPDLTVRQSSQPTRYILIVQDNGVGIPAHVDLKKLNSLGLKITYDLALQLRGTLELDSTNGTRFQLTFSALDYRKRL